MLRLKAPGRKGAGGRPANHLPLSPLGGLGYIRRRQASLATPGPIGEAVVGAEIVFLSVYSCPSCGVQLEAKEGRASDWLRCPKCGRPSLPPAGGVIRNRPREPLAYRDHSTGLSGAELLLLTDSSGASPSAHAGLKALVLLGAVSVTALTCLLMQRGTSEIVVVSAVTGMALLVLMRPRKTSRRA